MPEDEPARRALQEAIERLPADIRRKLWAVMRTGGGDYARADWDKAVTAADNVSDEGIANALADAVDLQDKLMKGLYALGLVAQASPPG